MSTLQVELYDALISAGAPEEKARAAAGAITDYRKTDDLATKADVAETKAETKADIARLEQNFAPKADFSHLKGSLATKADTAEIKENIDGVKADIDGVKANIAKLEAATAKLETDIAKLKGRTDAQFAELRTKFNVFIGLMIATSAGIAILVLDRIIGN